MFIARFVKLSYVWSPLQLHHKIGKKKHWIITYHGFFFLNCEVGGLVIMQREKSRIWNKNRPIYWQHERTYGLNMIISTSPPPPLEIGWISRIFSQKLLCTSHKPFVLLSNGEILSKKRLESTHFLNMIKIKDTNFALNFFLIFYKWDHMFIHLDSTLTIMNYWGQWGSK